MLYLTISEGETGKTTVALIATSDRVVLDAAMRALVRRLDDALVRHVQPEPRRHAAAQRHTLTLVAKCQAAIDRAQDGKDGA